MAFAVLAVLLAGGAALVLIAKAEGVDVGAEVQNVVDKISSVGSDVVGGLGLANDPISLATPIVKNFEGCVLTAYPDPPGSGKFSIGWGHQIRPGESYDQNSVIEQSEADDLLRIDIAAAYTCVTQNVDVDLTPNQAAALTSFCYNVGCAAFADSTLVQLCNQSDFEGASEQFPSWIHAGGVVSQALVDRRNMEQELFNA